MFSPSTVSSIQLNSFSVKYLCAISNCIYLYDDSDDCEDLYCVLDLTSF